MGLDIFLFKITKPTMLDKKVYTENELEEIQDKYRNLNFCFVDGNQKYCKTIRDNSIRIKFIENIFDLKKIENKTGIKNICYLENSKKDETSLTISYNLYNKESKKIGKFSLLKSEINDYLINSQSNIPKESSAFDTLVFLRKEIDYQRKGLSDYGWDLLPENCIYDDSITRLKKLCTKNAGLSKTFMKNFKKGETALVAWW